jgi:hypothetical protein
VPLKREVSQRRALLRFFIKKIVVDKDKARLFYAFPVPPEGKKIEEIRVLPIDTPNGAGGTIGRTFKLEFNLTI